jgi:hypothetical protein
MSKSIGDHFWAELTDRQKIDAVVTGRATMKQMSEGLLDGSEQLRNACREFLADTGPSFENFPIDPDEAGSQEEPTNNSSHLELLPRQINKTRSQLPPQTLKQRFGLPAGFVPRLQRYGRSVLIELNVYRLANGREFIPCRPQGTLGTRRHLYALLTSEQYLVGKRGSVYVRTDGKIFDYSVDTGITFGEMFDTGYTIADLERTGRYAPELPRRRKRRQPPKVKQAAAAG